MVRMQFPGLPAEQTIEVPESAVPTHERSGWRVIDPLADPAETFTAAPTGKRRTRKENS